MLLFSLLTSAVLATGACAKVTPVTVHVPREVPPAGAAPIQAATAEHVLDLRVRLAQRDPEGLRAALLAVSTPANARYGHHLSKAEVEAFTRPSSASSRTVLDFFAARGLNASIETSAGDWLRVRLPSRAANALFGADYRIFERAENGERVVRTLKYSIPAELRRHVRMVHPSTPFLGPRDVPDDPPHIRQRAPPPPPPPPPLPDFAELLGALNYTLISTLDAAAARSFARIVSSVHASPHNTDMSSTSLDLSGLPIWLQTRVRAIFSPAACKGATITPRCLQRLYGIPSTTQKGNSSTGLLVTGYGRQYAQRTDLRMFLEQFRPDVSPDLATFDVRLLDGGMNPQGAARAGVEANLDLQYAVSLAPGARTTFLSVGADVSLDLLGVEFLDTAHMLLDLDNPPRVVSTSYYRGEGDVPPDLAEALCDAYMALGARGVSVIFAAGDSGVDDPAGTCGRTDGGTGRFAPTFPASCPYVTAVGSTEGIAPETAAPFSSSGFSDHFAMPAYQASAVARYLDHLGSQRHAGRFNGSGRAFPDVSLQGRNFAVVVGGRTISQSGTSASAPVFASVIALLNDELAAGGRPPLGFLNPWLYSEAVAAAGAFTDVVSGRNVGCGGEMDGGFEAAPGWDPVTGLGTPNYPALRKAAGLA